MKSSPAFLRRRLGVLHNGQTTHNLESNLESQLVKMLNIGVIGYGYWGPNLVRNFSELSRAKVAGVSDLDPSRLALVATRYPVIKTTADFQELLRDPTIDAVAIATPVSTHFEIAMAALKAGKHVWLAKPMTETSLQARQLVDEAEKRQRVLLVDHTFVYTGSIRKVSEVVKSAKMGRLYYYDSIRVNLGLFQRDVNVISDLAAHDFAILDYLLAENPIAVSAAGSHHFAGTPENLAYITLFYDSGMIAHANVSWLAPVKVRQILIGGSKRMIVYNDLEPSEKVKIYDKGVSFTDDPRQIQEMRVGYRTGDMWAPKLEDAEALRVEGEHFLDCIENNSAPLTDGRSGLRVVELIEAATSSMRAKGETIHLRRRTTSSVRAKAETIHL
jgi:predicted dehydrogenase